MIKSVVKKIPFAFTLSQKIHDLLRKDLLHKQLKIKRFGGGGVLQTLQVCKGPRKPHGNRA